MPSAFALAISGFASQKSLRQIGWPMESRHSRPTIARCMHPRLVSHRFGVLERDEPDRGCLAVVGVLPELRAEVCHSVVFGGMCGRAFQPNLRMTSRLTVSFFRCTLVRIPSKTVSKRSRLTKHR